MAEQKESSVLFSLKELMNLEEDRIRQEENARRAAAEAEQRARLDAERRAREDEEQRMRAEEERRRVEEQRTREEAARLDAIRHAEVEKARLDAENAARLEAMRHQQEHERHLTAMAHDKHKKRLTYAAIGAAALLIIGGIGAGLAIKSSNEQHAIEIAKQQQELAEQKAQSEALQRQLTEQTQHIDQLMAQLESAKDEGAKQAIQKQIEDARRQQAATQRRIQTTGTSSGSGGASKPAKPCNCQPGDPLCSCIQ